MRRTPMAKKILVIDDENTSLRLIQALLAKKGHQVIIATDGDEGLDKAQKEKPDLIILDIVMPRITGGTLIKQMQRVPELKSIPVVIVTSHGTIGATFVGKGAKDYIQKPFKDEEFFEKVEKYLES